MASIVFWNVKANSSPRMLETIASIVRTLDVNLLILAESKISSAELNAELERLTGYSFRDESSRSSRLQVLTSLPKRDLSKVYDSSDGRLTIKRLTLGGTKLLLAGVHLWSKLHLAPEEQDILLRQEIIGGIRETESRLSNARTIVIGDFNMDPFQGGVCGALGFHAVMTAAIAKKGHRTVNGIDYPFFYNPMWSFFGDRSPCPPGTYFRHGGSPNSRFWHVFDQILMRPELIDAIESIDILDSVEGVSLLNRLGQPDQKRFSDHLPIHLRIRPNLVKEAV